jgi:hypothetical protein
VLYGVGMTTDTTQTEEIDTSKLGKIRALLDKAERTAEEFPDEAEALMAKAIELMERYRISEAMIADAAPLQDRGKLVEVSISVGSGPYANARITLANAIAQNNSVVLLQTTGYRGKSIHLNGYETDVALTEMLYTSLLVQATRALDNPETLARKPQGVHGTAFKRAFLIGFADRIATRLREASTVAAGAYQGTGRSVALVLADRSKDAQDFVFNRYGRLRSARPIAPLASYTGAAAGADAADVADISTNRRVTKSDTKALSA